MNPQSESGTYELVSHTADLGLRVRARTPADLYRTAGMALFRILVDGQVHVRPVEVPIEVSGIDREELFVRFLNELLYMYEERELVAQDLDITEVSDDLVRGVLIAVPLDNDIHEVQTDIKAATYHRVEVRFHEGWWEAFVVLDL